MLLVDEMVYRTNGLRWGGKLSGPAWRGPFSMHVRRYLESAAQRQLFQDVMHVAPDCVCGEMELVRDLLVAHATHDEIDHLPFSLGQPYGGQRVALALSRCEIGYLREERQGQRRREHVGALGHGANGVEQLI